MRRTPLKRGGRIRGKRRPPRAPYRLATWRRAQGACDWCHRPVGLGGGFQEHHIFYRSQTDPRIHDEPWNRSALHLACHALIHRDRLAREQLERLAVGWLFAGLPIAALRYIEVHQRGTTPTAVVRAYASWKRYEAPESSVEGA